MDEIGEVNIAPSRSKTIRLEEGEGEFVGFDRPPYLASFQLIGTPLSVQLVNVHVFYGSEAPADIARRALEACPTPEGWRGLELETPPLAARGRGFVYRRTSATAGTSSTTP